MGIIGRSYMLITSGNEKVKGWYNRNLKESLGILRVSAKGNKTHFFSRRQSSVIIIIQFFFCNYNTHLLKIV